MANAREDIKPEVLNNHLPQAAPYGVAEWGFVLETGQVCFVQVNEFNYLPGDHYLKVPVVLGVRTSEAEPHASVLPEQSGVLAIPDSEGKSICYANVEREVGDVWHASLKLGIKQIGSALGTVGTATPFSVIEAALVALVRHASALNS